MVRLAGPACWPCNKSVQRETDAVCVVLWPIVLAPLQVWARPARCFGFNGRLSLLCTQQAWIITLQLAVWPQPHGLKHTLPTLPSIRATVLYSCMSEARAYPALQARFHRRLATSNRRLANWLEHRYYGKLCYSPESTPSQSNLALTLPSIPPLQDATMQAGAGTTTDPHLQHRPDALPVDRPGPRRPCDVCPREHRQSWKASSLGHIGGSYRDAPAFAASGDLRVRRSHRLPVPPALILWVSGIP